MQLEDEELEKWQTLDNLQIRVRQSIPKHLEVAYIKSVLWNPKANKSKEQAECHGHQRFSKAEVIIL